MDNNIITSKIVLKEMLLDRGVIDKHLVPIDEAEIKINDYTSILLPEEKTAIFYDLKPKFKWTDVLKKLNQDYGEDMTDIELVIFIIYSQMTASHKKINIKCHHQVFSLYDLQMNISKHFLQPKMKLIANPEDIDKIIKQYDLKFKTQLPQMLSSDPMAKYFNAKPGNLMQIDRVSPTSAINTIYRLVV